MSATTGSVEPQVNIIKDVRFWAVIKEQEAL